MFNGETFSHVSLVLIIVLKAILLKQSISLQGELTASHLHELGATVGEGDVPMHSKVDFALSVGQSFSCAVPFRDVAEFSKPQLQVPLV